LQWNEEIMNLSRIKQLYRRRDRLQDMVDAQYDEIMKLAVKQIEIERKAYEAVYPKSEAKDESYWRGDRGRNARHLSDWYYRLDKYEALNVECWGRGCRGGEDWLETAFKIDERITSEEGQQAMFVDYVAKYQALKDKQKRDARASLEAERRRLEERLRELGDQS
jgi:hypothetical protein